jgi:clan AA aspartic protease (TIGR02281 family)
MNTGIQVQTAALLISSAIFCIVSGCSRAIPDRRRAELDSLRQTRDWFKLRDAVESGRADPHYRALVAWMFHDMDAAEKYADEVLQRAAPGSDDANQAHYILGDIYERWGLYRKALSELQVSRQSSGTPIDGNRIALLSAIAGFPPQSVVARSYSKVRWNADHGIPAITASVNGNRADFFVDTSATDCVITQAEAERLGLRVLPAPGFSIGTASGGVDASVAVADELAVGGFRLHNVVFVVIPTVKGGPKNIAIRALGLPVLLAFQTLRWNRDGLFEIAFPAEAADARRANLCLDSWPIVQADFQGVPVMAQLDSGANTTHLLPRFAKEFPHAVPAGAGKDTLLEFGASGAFQRDATTIPEVRLRIGGFDWLLKPAELMDGEIESARPWHAKIGSDLFSQAQSVTIDFRAMRLSAR